MGQTDLLWAYQQADSAVDAFFEEIKKNPKRIALQNKLAVLKEQQATIKKMEQDIADMTERSSDYQEDAAVLMEEVEKWEKLAAKPEITKEEVERIAEKMAKIDKELLDIERQLQRIIRETAEKDKLRREIRVKYSKIKTEYDTEKAAYDAVYAEQMKLLDEKKAALASQGQTLDPQLLAKYTALKKHISRPVAKLYNGQCGGCMMNLPQASLQKFKADTLYIECENCGRMIIQKSED